MALTLAAQWTNRNNTATDVVDDTGNGFDCTKTDGFSSILVWAPVWYSPEQQIDNTWAVGTCSSEAEPGTGSWSWCEWVYIKDTSQARYHTSASKADGDSHFRICYNHSSTKVLITLGKDSDFENLSVDTGAVPFDEWNHYTTNIDRVAGKVRVYKNAVFQAEASIGIQAGTYTGWRNADTNYANNYYRARFADKRIYTGGILSTDDMKAIMREAYHYTQPTMVDCF